jgi:hypothetical protein
MLIGFIGILTMSSNVKTGRELPNSPNQIVQKPPAKLPEE